MKRIDCVSCGREKLNKNTIGLNKKLLGMDVINFYCMDCLAAYLDTTVLALNAKIEEFKDEGCKLFE